ncbi:MAG: hypothetical protein IJQ80_07725, partial [Clostridia bacterium]|nr:hypothetical protein [Clostridia bacterium]
EVKYLTGTAILIGDGYEKLSYTPLLPNRHEFGASEALGEIKAGNTETVRVICTNEAFPGIKLTAYATATLADLRIPTVITSNPVTITYGDDLKPVVCDAITITGDDGATVEFTPDDITIDPENPDAKLFGSQDVTVKFGGNHDYAASEGTISVKVNRAPSSLDAKSESITYGETPALKVITSPEDLDYLMLIGGIDTNVSAFISLYIPQSIREKMKVEIAGFTVFDFYESLSNAMKDGVTFNELRNIIVGTDELLNSSLGDMIAENSDFDIDSLKTVFDLLAQIPEIDINAKITLGNPPKNAGLYAVAAVSTDSNYKISADVAYLTIAPKTNTEEEPVVLQFKNDIGDDNFLTYEEAQEFEFGGEIVVSGNSVGSDNVYAAYLGITAEDLQVSLTDTPVTEPGVYPETLAVIGGNYLPEPISRIYTVGKKKVEITSPELTVPYDGNAHEIEFTVTPDTVDESEISVRYVGEDYDSDSAPTAAGTYYVYLSYSGDPTHLSASTTSKLTISQAEVTVDVYCVGTLYYGQIGLVRGDPAGLKVVVTGVPEGEEFEATPYIVEDDNFPHVGEYRVSARFEPNANYNVTVNEATLTILPVPVKIIIDNAEKTYGDDNPDFTFRIVDPTSESAALKYGETAERAKIADITPATDADSSSAPASYDIYANVGDTALSDDYEVQTVVNGVLTVNPREATVAIGTRERNSARPIPSSPTRQAEFSRATISVLTSPVLKEKKSERTRSAVPRRIPITRSRSPVRTERRVISPFPQRK